MPPILASGVLPCSRLGERRARTAGTFCRRDEAELLGGSTLGTTRGLGFGGGAPALACTRALTSVPDIERGGPNRGALGEDSTFVVSLCRDVRDEEGCSGEFERPGEETAPILCMWPDMACAPEPPRTCRSEALAAVFSGE